MKEKIYSFTTAIIKSIYKIFGKEISDETLKILYQFVGFAIVGVSNFLVNYIVYVVCLKVLGSNYHVANICAFIISVFNSFYWNNRYIFRAESGERNWFVTLIKTYISYGFTGLILTEILLIIEISVLGLSEILGPVINVFITTPINFLISKFWTFKK